MALAIATNSAALQAAASASSVNRDMETSMARLASGMRINSASDDAAGVAIASRLSSEIRGTDQAIRNALDGQAIIDTAEGAHKETEAILQRMREIAVQAANDTNSAEDRVNLQTEMDAMVKEIDRIAHVTTWAGNSVMDGSDGSASSSKVFSLQVGTATGDKNQIAVTVKSLTSATLGLTESAASDKNKMLVVGDTANEGFVTAKHLNTVDADGDGNATDDTGQENALKTITVIDAAIKTVNTQRSELGAVSNRLSHTVANLTNISANLSAAKGGIEDADFAVETTELAKNQILQQASTAMLAQANASKQNVLSLLQG
jgi:flagellin